MQSFIKAISIITVMSFISGCCSIMQGTKQSVGISSTPTGAAVCVDNMACGVTPLIKDLKRGDEHIIKIEMQGYMPHEIALTKKVSGWVWGNIVFGGLVGLIVDAATGGMYILTPEQISVTLIKENAKHLYKKNTLYVAVVLSPDPAWQKIGQMQKSK